MTTNARSLASCWNRQTPRKRKCTCARYLLMHPIAHPHRGPTVQRIAMNLRRRALSFWAAAKNPRAKRLLGTDRAFLHERLRRGIFRGGSR